MSKSPIWTKVWTDVGESMSVDERSCVSGKSTETCLKWLDDDGDHGHEAFVAAESAGGYIEMKIGSSLKVKMTLSDVVFELAK